MRDLSLLLFGAFLEVAATIAIVMVPELLDCLMGTDDWPGER
jgi:hypothetical protein